MSKKPVSAKKAKMKKISKISASSRRTNRALKTKAKKNPAHLKLKQSNKKIRRNLPDKAAKTIKKIPKVKATGKSPVPKTDRYEKLQQKKSAELPVEKIENEYNELKMLLVQKRKSGVDTLIEELKLFTIPSKLQLLKADFSQKDYDKIQSTLSEVQASLESAKPTSTPLDTPMIEENPESPFKGISTAHEEHPLAEDARNYAKELSTKKLSLSSIKEKISILLKKRGGK